VTHGQFTGDGMQDVFAISAAGTPEIYAGPGDGTALNPSSGTTMFPVSGFIDPNNGNVTASNNETITQITAVGKLPSNGMPAATNTAYPDLIAVVHDTNTTADADSKPYQLWWFQADLGTGLFENAHDLDSLNDGIDWSTKTITGTSYDGEPALIVRDNASGAISLYPTCGTSACDDANWFTASPVISSAPNAATTAANAPGIASQDATNATDPNGNPIPDLWATSPSGAITFSTLSTGTQPNTVTISSPVAAGTVAASPLTPAGAIRWTNPASGKTQVDVYATDTDGRLWDYQQQPTNAYLATPTLVSSGPWNNVTVFGIADWNHDGYPDIVARDNTTCTMGVYPGSATGFAIKPTPIGSGWCGFTPFGVADWYHNGHQDIVARDDATGIMWLYPGDLTGGAGNRTELGAGFTAGTYDPDGLINFDGATDASGQPANELIIRRNTDHTLQLYPGTGPNNALTGGGTQIGSGFTTDYTYVGFLHYNTDSTTEIDLITRQPNTHNLQLFEANGTGQWTDGLGTTIITNSW
jgi:hypothetical protein